MKNKKWMLPASVGALLLTLLAGILIGKLWSGTGSEEEVSDWLSDPVENEDGRLKEKNLELLGQVVLLKKMLGEIDGTVVILGPTGSFPIARGRLVWDAAKMEGFIHAVKLKSSGGSWFVEGYDKGKRSIRCEVAAPDAEGKIQQVFRPQGRLLGWDEFRLIHQNEQGKQEVVLVGQRSL